MHRTLPIPCPDLLPLHLRELLWEDGAASPSDDDASSRATQTEEPAPYEPTPSANRIAGFYAWTGDPSPNGAVRPRR